MAGRGVTAETNMRPSLTDIARRGWSWWRDEIAALVPNGLRARASGARAEIDCVLLSDGRVAGARAASPGGALPSPEGALAPGEALSRHLAELAEAAPQGTVRLCVPRDLCFLRRSQLPRRALPHAGALLRLEAEALLPFEPGESFSDWYVETENVATRELEVIHVILARERIRAVEEACAGVGLALVRVSVGDAEGRPMPVDLLSRQEASFRAALARLSPLARWLGAAALLLALATPFLLIARQDAALAELSAARAALPKASPTAQSATAVADFLDARASRVPVSMLLDELARRLPPGTTLTALRLEGKRLLIDLQGGESGAVREALAGSPLLSEGIDTAPDQLAFELRPLPERPAREEGAR